MGIVGSSSSTSAFTGAGFFAFTGAGFFGFAGAGAAARGGGGAGRSDDGASAVSIASCVSMASLVDRGRRVRGPRGGVQVRGPPRRAHLHLELQRLLGRERGLLLVRVNDAELQRDELGLRRRSLRCVRDGRGPRDGRRAGARRGRLVSGRLARRRTRRGRRVARSLARGAHGLSALEGFSALRASREDRGARDHARGRVLPARSLRARSLPACSSRACSSRERSSRARSQATRCGAGSVVGAGSAGVAGGSTRRCARRRTRGRSTASRGRSAASRGRFAESRGRSAGASRAASSGHGLRSGSGCAGRGRRMSSTRGGRCCCAGSGGASLAWPAGASAALRRSHARVARRWIRRLFRARIGLAGGRRFARVLRGLVLAGRLARRARRGSSRGLALLRSGLVVPCLLAFAFFRLVRHTGRHVTADCRIGGTRERAVFEIHHGGTEARRKHEILRVSVSPW